MNQIEDFRFPCPGSRNGLFGELTVAYRTGRKELIKRIVGKVREACRAGFEIATPGVDDDLAEDYTGNDPKMLAAKYIVTLYRSEYGQDEYDCREYLLSGLIN